MQTFLTRYRFPVLYISLWIVVVIVHILVMSQIYGFPWATSIIDSFVFNTIFALLGIGLWFTTRFSHLKNKGVVEILIRHVVIASIVVMVWLGTSNGILFMLFSSNPSAKEYLSTALTPRVFNGLFFYGLLVSIYYLIDSFRELQRKINREAMLLTQLRDAELSMLRSQIRPHFLFNSLNSINALILSNSDKAQEMVVKLSEFMRYSLSHQDESTITLEQELYHMGLYLDIEKVRFSDRLNIEKKICDKCLSRKLPAMILQPLIENAVKHGVYGNVGAVNIYINAELRNDLLYLQVRNNFDHISSARKGTGTGLRNIEKRLQTLYNRYDLMVVRKQENVFEVELAIPRYEEP